MRDYLAASSAAQYRVAQCFVDKNTNAVNYERLWKFLGTCQLFCNSCTSFQKVSLMQIMTLQDKEFTSERLVEIADRQDALSTGRNARAWQVRFQRHEQLCDDAEAKLEAALPNGAEARYAARVDCRLEVPQKTSSGTGRSNGYLCV